MYNRERERVGKGDNANTTPCFLQNSDKVMSLSHAACPMSCLSASTTTVDERNA